MTSGAVSAETSTENGTQEPGKRSRSQYLNLWPRDEGRQVFQIPHKATPHSPARAPHATSPPPSAFTHNSRVQGPGCERLDGRARRCGPGSPANGRRRGRRESPPPRDPQACLDPPQSGGNYGALLPAAVPTTSGPRPRYLPLRPLRATLFLLVLRSALPGRSPHRGAGQRASSTMHPAKPSGWPPKLGWGRIPPTYIFPPPRPPPALHSR